MLRFLSRLPGRWRLSEPGDGYMSETSRSSDPGSPCYFHRFSGPAEVFAEITAAGFRGRETMSGWWICSPGGR